MVKTTTIPSKGLEKSGSMFSFPLFFINKLNFGQEYFWIFLPCMLNRYARNESDKSFINFFIQISKDIWSFYPHFTWLCASWNHQRILKKYPFWICESCFSSYVSKFTSVRNMLDLSLKYWFMEAKIVSCVCHGPQKWSKYYLDTIQSLLSKNINY